MVAQVNMTPDRGEFAYPLHTMIRKDQRGTFDRVIDHSMCPLSLSLSY
jgi:hypothetical protein